MTRSQEEQKSSQQKATIKNLLERAQGEGFPTDPEERETYFMQQVGEGERISGEGETKALHLNLMRQTSTFSSKDQS